jgi:hypothetical protein
MGSCRARLLDYSGQEIDNLYRYLEQLERAGRIVRDYGWPARWFIAEQEAA